MRAFTWFLVAILLWVVALLASSVGGVAGLFVALMCIVFEFVALGMMMKKLFQEVSDDWLNTHK